MQEGKQKSKFCIHWRGLSKNDTNALKAVSIVMIVLHNFFHVFPGWDIENEFVFRRSNFDFFRNSILSSGFFDALGLLFSYFGHYGVDIFVFLSSYGLYVSYQNKKLHYRQFIKDRVLKLYPAFFLAVLLYLALHIIATKSFNHPNLYFGSLLRLTLVSNFVPGQSFRVVGPWWFYSMIFQFYLIFPLLRRLFDKFGAIALVLLSIVSYVLQLLFNNILDQQGLLINTTIIGHLPVFTVGFIIAKKNDISMPWWAFLAVSLLFYYGNYNQLGWLFNRLWFVVGMLYVYLFIKQFFPFKRLLLTRSILFIGTVSMYIFAVNGFLRHPFMNAVLRTNSFVLKLLLVLCFVIYVLGVALLLRIAERLSLKIILQAHKVKKM